MKDLTQVKNHMDANFVIKNSPHRLADIIMKELIQVKDHMPAVFVINNLPQFRGKRNMKGSVVTIVKFLCGVDEV